MLQNTGVDHAVVLYLKTKPDRATLEALIAKLEDDPSQLVRRDKFFTDTIVGEQGFDPATLSDPAVVAELLAANPRLIQRPVLITGDRAIIGRPKDRVPAFIQS